MEIYIFINYRKIQGGIKMNEIILNVEGMMCGGCEKRIENALGEVKAIKNVKANHEDGTVKIESKKEIDMDVVKEKIENLGFKVK